MDIESNVKLVSIKTLGSQSELDIKKVKVKSEDQSVNHSIARLSMAVGIVTFMMVVTTGAFLMIGGRYVVRHDPIWFYWGTVNVTNMTDASQDWRNRTHLRLDERLVPSTAHNGSHNQLVSNHSDHNQNESHQKVSLSPESSFTENPRVKRAP